MISHGGLFTIVERSHNNSKSLLIPTMSFELTLIFQRFSVHKNRQPTGCLHCAIQYIMVYVDNSLLKCYFLVEGLPFPYAAQTLVVSRQRKLAVFICGFSPSGSIPQSLQKQDTIIWYISQYILYGDVLTSYTAAIRSSSSSI